MDLRLTQRQAAKVLGVLPSTVFNWERGVSHPNLRAIPRIVRFLDGDARPVPGTLGGQIRRLRQARGWSTRELAKKLRVDPSTVENWERRGFNPHPRLYARLARILPILEPGSEAPIGQRLRARRLAKGLTQAKFGRLLGVCQDVVSRWEAGRSQIGAQYRLEVARFLSGRVCAE